MPTTIVSDGGNAAQLSNSQLMRPLSIGTNWTEVRIGFRFRAVTESNITGSPRLYAGLCDKDGGQVGDLSVGNFVGIRSNAATWTYSSSSGGVIYSFSGSAGDGWAAVHKYGSTEDVTANGAGSADVNSFATKSHLTTTDKSAWVVSLIKTATDVVTVSHFHPTPNSAGNSVIGPVTTAEFIAFMEAVTLSRSGWSSHTLTGIATGESTYGDLNAVNIAWDRTSVPLIIDDLLVARIS